MAEYIDKQKLMKNFGGYDLTKCQKYGNTSQKQRNMSYDTMMMYEIADEISYFPAADVAQVVHGRWRKSKEGVCGDYLFVCSACGADYWESPSFYKQAHYCPNCGAKMDKEV